MSTSGVLLTTLSPAISKGLLSLWLADSQIAKEIGAASIDVLKVLVPDAVKQRRMQRLFDEIGDKAVEHLEPIIGTEFQGIDEATKNAAIALLASRLNAGILSPGSIVKRNIDPASIALLIRDGTESESRLLGEEGASLFRLLSEEVARQVCGVVSAFPSFSESTASELLGRTAQIAGRVDEVFDQVSRIRASIPDYAGLASIEFERNYLVSVGSLYDKVELFGIDADEHSMRYPLSTAYVSLSLQRSVGAANENSPIHSGEHDALIDQPSVSIEELISGSHALLVRGLAGQGKTTLVQWVAVQVARRECKPPIDDWNDYIPFIIKLRYFPKSLPALEEFARATVSAIPSPPNGWIEAQFRTGRALLLVDGIDEVARAQRPRVREWIDSLHKLYPLVKLIVTSRPSAVKEGWLDSSSFHEAEIELMDRGDIIACVEHWHRAVAFQMVGQKQREELVVAERRLLDEIHINKQVRGLMTNPLLCAMVCALNLTRHHHLPRDRVELYEAACKMFLDRRDRERGIQTGDYPDLTYRQKLVILQEIAYWMLRNKLNEIGSEDFDRRIEETFEGGQGIAGGATADIRRYLVERTGILREPANGRIDFTHRTFLEYLAARQVVADDDTGLATENAAKDDWKEVIVLMAGIVESNRRREDLVTRLLDRGDQNPQLRHRLHLLAVACLETSPTLSKKTRDRIEECLGRVVPPKNMTDARDVSSAGAMAIGHLRWVLTLKAGEAAACVRALRHIGGDEALVALREYALDTRQTVRTELIRTWDFFESGAYATEVLSKMPPSEGTLVLTRKASLAGLHALSWVKGMDLVRPALGIDLSELASLGQLTSLTLDGVVNPANIEALGKLPRLTSVAIRNSFISSELPIDGMEGLSKLAIIGGEVSVGQNALRALPDLGELSIAYISKLKAIPQLHEKCQLFSISLSTCADLRGIDALKTARSLRSLRVVRCPNMVDFSVLQHLPQMSDVVIRDVGPSADLRVSLSRAARIRRLAIDSKALPAFGDVAHIEPIPEFALHGLDHDDDIGHLTSAKRQTSISLIFPKDLTPIGQLSHLAALEISTPFKGRLDSFGVLGRLRRLQTLALRGRWVDVDFGVLERLSWIRKIDLHGYVGPISPELLSRLRSVDLIKISRWHELLLRRAGLKHLPKNVFIQP